jgi:hypothetical protein
MLRLTQDEFIILACLADYNLTAYEILGFAKDLTYMIPLENLYLLLLFICKNLS